MWKYDLIVSPIGLLQLRKQFPLPISLLQQYIREDLASLSDNIHFEMYYKYDGNSYFELVAELIFIFECDSLEIPLKALLSSNIH